MDTKYRDQVEAIIREIVEANPTEINANIADEVTNRLGKPIRKDEIAQIKREIGLGTYALAAEEIARQLMGMAKIAPATSEYNLQDLALLMAVNCVRNTVIETYHAGKCPRSKTGDYSDVRVVTPYGEIQWTEVSRITNEEMKAFNIEVSNRIYTMLEILFDPEFDADRERLMVPIAAKYPHHWNKPVLDTGLIIEVEHATIDKTPPG